MANLVTTLRLTLLFVLVWLAYEAPPQWQLANAPLLLLIFALDGVDGWIARARHEESLFGSIYDIAADRIVENVLWLVLADLDLIPVWVALVFLTRGILVDAVRSVGASQGASPFSLTKTRVGRFLVAGRLMRGAYGVVKAGAFGWLFLWQPWPDLHPEFWARWQPGLQWVGAALVYGAVAMCLARGLPVLLEFGLADGRLLHRRPPKARP
ncbi:MAG: CDP-alcohol phosphatidyltransferase family protein [Gammaproteobacteria bacterium]|nr:CDP-alcohol phosphatidyltransferase family protein [Gammaproteobacteria bacterium]